MGISRGNLKKKSPHAFFHASQCFVNRVWNGTFLDGFVVDGDIAGVQQIKIRNMKIEKLKLETVKFATIAGNRDVDTKKLMKAIKKDGRVIVPILAIQLQDIQDKDLVLYDLRTGLRIEKPSPDCYVVIDGQHRCMCAQQLFEEMQTEGSDLEFTDFIYANIFEKEDIQDEDTISIIIGINSTTKSWGAKDYVKSAYTHNPEDETMIVVNVGTELRCSISNMSRYLCNNHKMLTPLVLSHYISGDSELPECNPRKALEMLRMLHDRGFSIDFLRKRYLAEEIVLKHNSDRLEGFLNSLYHLDNMTVKKIEALSPQDYDNHKIRVIVQDFEKNLCIEERTKSFVPDLSDKRFNDNIEHFKKIVEELKLTKNAKKIRKSRSLYSTQKSEVNIADCTADDVK